jgi:hypothetical protein
MAERLISRLAWLLFVCPVALGQTTGKIEGRISDSSGSPVPGALVEATSPSLQGVRSSTSSGDGTYRFPALPPGIYRVRAALPGFRSAEERATVSLDTTTTADLILYPIAEARVVVSGEAPEVDSTSTTTGTQYTHQVIEKLPVGRNYADIVRSNPAVESDRGTTLGRSLALTIYGATSAENLWIVDGVNTTNVLKGIQGKAINVEFVQEVEVKTGGYQAEYGRALGGIINVSTKSGGNDFHGDAFGYYDSSALSARQVSTSEDSQVRSMNLVDYRRTEVGAALGGFLLRDRVWFFAAYDRVDLPAEISRYVANAFVSTSDRFPVNGTDTLYSGKLTWNIAASSTLVATVFADPTTNSGAGGADPRLGHGSVATPPVTYPDRSTWDSTRRIGATDYALRGSQLFGAGGLLAVQASRHQDRYSLEFADIVRIRDFTCEGGTPESPCSPPQTENFATGGYGSVFGPEDRSSSRRDQYRADLSLYSGSHEMKFGVDFQDGRTLAVSSYSGGQLVSRKNELGTLYYRHQFFVRSFDDPTPTEGTVAPRVLDLGLFAQDSWKPAAGLTVSAGLRWDQEDVRGAGGITALKTTAEWQPRIGLAWDPWKDGKTKIYGFAGRFYYALPTDLAAKVYGDAVTRQTFNFDPASLTQDPSVPGHSHAIQWGGASGMPVDSGLKGIRQDEFTFGLERLLAPAFSVGVKATYRRLGNTIEDRCDLDYNWAENSFSSCALVNPGSNERFAHGDFYSCSGFDDPYNNCYADPYTPVFGAPSSPPARRLYRGIEVLARKSIDQKAWLQASYVYSFLRGNYDGAVNEMSFGGMTDPGITSDFDYPQLAYNGYGRLFLDRPHRFRLDAAYTTPFRLSIGAQAYVRSGAPMDQRGYFNQWGYGVYLVPRGSAGRMPTEWEANLTLSYPVVLGPLTTTVQAYVFNLFNNQIATARDTVWSSSPPAGYPKSLFDPNQEKTNPNYGKITSRQEPRVVRFALKLSF